MALLCWSKVCYEKYCNSPNEQGTSTESSFDSRGFHGFLSLQIKTHMTLLPLNFFLSPPVLIWCCECCGHTRRLLWRQKAQLKSSWRTCRAFSLAQDTAPVQTHGILITDWLIMPAIFKVILGLAQALEQLFHCWTYTSAMTSLSGSSVKA